MPDTRGVTVHVEEVGGTDVVIHKEYGLVTPRDSEDEKKKSRYIVGEPGQQFAVYVEHHVTFLWYVADAIMITVQTGAYKATKFSLKSLQGVVLFDSRDHSENVPGDGEASLAFKKLDLEDNPVLSRQEVESRGIEKGIIRITIQRCRKDGSGFVPLNGKVYGSKLEFTYRYRPHDHMLRLGKIRKGEPTTRRKEMCGRVPAKPYIRTYMENRQGASTSAIATSTNPPSTNEAKLPADEQEALPTEELKSPSVDEQKIPLSSRLSASGESDQHSDSAFDETDRSDQPSSVRTEELKSPSVDEQEIPLPSGLGASSESDQDSDSAADETDRSNQPSSVHLQNQNKRRRAVHSTPSTISEGNSTKKVNIGEQSRLSSFVEFRDGDPQPGQFFPANPPPPGTSQATIAAPTAAHSLITSRHPTPTSASIPGYSVPNHPATNPQPTQVPERLSSISHGQDVTPAQHNTADPPPLKTSEVRTAPPTTHLPVPPDPPTPATSQTTTPPAPPTTAYPSAPSHPPNPTTPPGPSTSRPSIRTRQAALPQPIQNPYANMSEREVRLRLHLKDMQKLRPSSLPKGDAILNLDEEDVYLQLRLIEIEKARSEVCAVAQKMEDMND
ncbi:hypothetical protein K490DRAFT_68475 [Saccharata proteae CBS 121410]|uniref:Uncharacterized protein n=1 Tax=Saccharata proteae CBS 121410 TaxID=1314787 RepID=A0A9P4LX75_9PEZI|nr:hypothetical protein K490DRAFT_68475 [Saccharata proteae CBS 121410]